MRAGRNCIPSVGYFAKAPLGIAHRVCEHGRVSPTRLGGEKDLARVYRIALEQHRSRAARPSPRATSCTFAVSHASFEARLAYVIPVARWNGSRRRDHASAFENGFVRAPIEGWRLYFETCHQLGEFPNSRCLSS